MPLSETSITALRAIAGWHPEGLRALLAILTEAPHHVKHKDDRFGPLSFILLERPATKIAGVTVASGERFPADKLALCETFGEEWRQCRFTRQELRDAMERVLTEEIGP